ncbi:MAG: sulfotransferase domain-containing protein [Myxococcota bacterium]
MTPHAIDGRRWVAAALGEARRGFTGIQEQAAGAARVAGFLRGALEFEPRPDDVFVATYPRSGTTWMQFIVHLLVSGGNFDFRHISDVSPWYERTLALGTRRASDFDRLPGPRVFKTHLIPEWLPNQGRFIHVHREGSAVVRSYYGLYRSHLGYSGSFDAFFRRFMEGRVQYGSWFDHRRRWLRRTDGRVIHIRYESMEEDLLRVVSTLAAFLRLDVPNELRHQILQMATKRFMKTHEDRFDPITEHLIDRGFLARNFIAPDARTLGLTRDQEHMLLHQLQRDTEPRSWKFLELPAFLH